MPAEKIKITDEDIDLIEKFLLPKGKTFDDERREFIKNLETIDLQAVPGSGKTTALLAKLSILENKIQGTSECGILMLSHTNAAIDEIKSKIGNLCPKLFEYPNFVGTIQSFVDEFLAIPYYSNKYKTRPYSINSEMYYSKLNNILKICLQDEEYETYKKVLYIKNSNEKLLLNYRFSLNLEGKVILLNELNGKNLEIKKPRPASRNYLDYSATEKEKVTNYLKKVKYKIMKDRILHYDDAYFLANDLLIKKPDFKNYLQSRFKFVFVDEMQDMDEHQVDILEKVFYDQGDSTSVYQRIGDKNQAIHTNVSSKDAWGAREKGPLKMTGSHRLTAEIASIVSNFGLEYIKIDGLKSTEASNIKPCIIFFTDPNTVLEKFTKVIKEKGLADIITQQEYPFRAIGWTETHENIEKLGIRSYCPVFRKNQNQVKENHQFLYDFLLFSGDTSKNITLEHIQNNIIRAFLKILQELNKTDETDNFYIKNSFLRFLKENHEEQYQDFKVNLYNWSNSIFKNVDVYSKVQEYFKSFLKELYPNENLVNQKVKDFLEGRLEDEEIQIPDTQKKDSNIHVSNDVKVKLGTIHSVKGETHVATLYLESFYQGKYESERLSDQINGVSLFNNERVYDQQATKMMYVGLSRPTNLLCLAVHTSRGFIPNPEIWEIIE